MFRTKQNIYFLLGYDPDNLSSSSVHCILAEWVSIVELKSPLAWTSPLTDNRRLCYLHMSLLTGLLSDKVFIPSQQCVLKPTSSEWAGVSCCGQFHPLLSYKYSFFLPSLTYFLSNKNTVKVVARIVSDYPYYPPALIRVTSIAWSRCEFMWPVSPPPLPYTASYTAPCAAPYTDHAPSDRASRL